MQNSIRWTVLPAKNRKKLALFFAIVLPFLLLVLLSSGIFWTLFSAIVLILALSPFFTPTTYTLDKGGVTVKRLLYTIKRDWESIRRYEFDGRGIFLSPYSKPRRMENFRGIYLMLNENREEVLQFLEKIFHGRDREKNREDKEQDL
jgi:hypothetical protein